MIYVGKIGLFITLGKIATNVGKEIIAWTRTISSKRLLATRPIKVSVSELKLAPKLEGDVIQISKQATRWTENPNEYIPNCNITNSQIPSHHMVDGRNSNIRDVVDLRKGIIEDCEMFGGYQAIRIDKEFAKFTPLEKDCIGYRIVGRSNYSSRNLPFNVIENDKIGDTVILDEGCAYAFQQESLISLNNHNLKNPMLEIIKIPKGARVSRNMEHGGEILMPRGAAYKLTSKEATSNGEIEVVLEYILPKSKYPKDIRQIGKIAEQHINSTDEFNRKYAHKILDEISGLSV